MNIYRPWICVIAISLGQYAYAKSDYDAYRMGHYHKAFKALDVKSGSDPVADYYLGRMYLYGYGQLRNENLAIRFFKKAAAKGYLPAQLFMGKYYLQIENNPEEAFGWFKKAADQNDLSAQMMVAASYLYGFGTKKNPSLARRYYIDAAKNDDPIAQYTLAEHFLESRQSSNHRLAVIWLKKAANDGNNFKAQTKLGELYATGRYVPRDVPAAREYLEKAVSQGYIPAMIVLGELALKEKKPEEAESWYQKAAELKNSQAQFKLAQLYLDEKGGLHNEEQGFMWMMKAALSGLPEAQRSLSELYKKGTGTEENAHLAEEWLKKAEQGGKSEKESDPAVMAARWLSNDASDRFDLPQWQATGIYTAWGSEAARRDTIYNQSPIIEEYGRQVLFKPQFLLAQPSEVPLHDYYEALLKNTYRVKNSEWIYPEYPLGKHLEAHLLASSYVAYHPDLTLPYADVYTLPPQETVEIDWFASWLPEEESRLNYLSLFNDMYGRAILGNSHAQFHIGQMFQHGLGVTQSKHQAIVFYEKAAMQQHLPAQYSLAVLYLKQEEDADAYMQGVKWLRDAAFKGNRYAQYVMSKILKEDAETHHAVKANEEQATSMLYLSAANGYGLAQYELAEKMAHAKDVSLSVGKQLERRELIRELYQGAAKQGVVEALLPLAFFNAMEKDPALQKQAYNIAKHQADLGHSEAALLLGILYDRGIGVAASQNKAMEWFAKSGSNVVSRFIIGTYMSEGKGMPKDLAKGQQLLRQSAAESFSYADLNLAVLAEHSQRDFLPDLVKAYQLGNSRAGLLLADYTLASHDNPEGLQRARSIYSGLADKGDQFAQLKLAYMYDKGIGAPANAESAHKWYLAAAEQGNAMAQYQLGQLYQSGRLSRPDYEKALAWYGKAAKKLPAALVATGFIEETVADQYAKAMHAYQQAAAEGDALGAYNLALMYEYGKGVAVNYHKAKEYYQQAADKGVSLAMTQLAGLYFNGAGTERNVQEALAWYKKAAATGEHNALYQLGLLSETGVATKLDYDDAAHYYQKAAQKGNEKAMIALARMHQYGLGIEKDELKARQWYEQLAERHNGYAQYQLATFYLEGRGGEPRLDKARELLKRASENGHMEASQLLRAMEAQSKSQISYIEPALMNQTPAMSGQPADLIYFDALAEWNRGDETLSRMMLQRLMTNFPHYLPAKRAFDQLNKAPEEVLPMVSWNQSFNADFKKRSTDKP